MREHGTRARYVRGPDENDDPGPCRCAACCQANTAEAGRVYRLRAYGRWEPIVDAGPALQHARALVAVGLKAKRIAELSGVSHPTVARLLDEASGRDAQIRIRAKTAAALLAVQPSPEMLKPRARVDATGARRRLQALVAAGWTVTRLAARLGMDDMNVNRLLRARTARADTVQRVAALYSRLWDQRPDAVSPQERAASTRARGWAKREGWLLPACWDDELIDLPEADLAVELDRRVAGMGAAEISRCWTARYKHGDWSVLIGAAAREHTRRRNARQHAVEVA